MWDYGPLGVELKNNVKRAWWRAMVQERDDIVGLDAGILMHPQVWVTSGHVGSFSDPLVECQTDHRRFRLDELPGGENLSATDLRDPGIVERLGLKCPVDGGPLSAPRQFNLMFKTHMGPIEEDSNAVYLRPETAQGSYVNFKNVQQSSRKKLPFGIAQIGKSFRNEISPGNFVFRMREFEQMEMQYFVRPDDAARIFEEWLPRRWDWYTRYGVNPARLRFREHAPDELAHYAKKAIDVEYRFPFGWKELEGVHNRGDFDLSRHAEASGENLEYFDPATEEHFIPWIVETAGGAGSRGVHVPDRQLPRGGGPRREARLLGAERGPRAVQGRGPAAAQEAARDRGACAQAPRRHRPRHDGRVRRHGRDRQAVPAPGRDRDAVVRLHRRRLARGRRRHDPRPRLDDPGAAADRWDQARDPGQAVRRPRRLTHAPQQPHPVEAYPAGTGFEGIRSKSYLQGTDSTGIERCGPGACEHPFESVPLGYRGDRRAAKAVPHRYGDEIGTPP